MATSTLTRPQYVHLQDVYPRARIYQRWEPIRHRKVHWFVECVAEALGVFFFVYGGLGANAPWTLGNYLGNPLSSLFQVGFAYSIGVVLAVIICGPTSGGHFNPGVTIAFVLFKKFPRWRALRYIIAQTIGAYIACILIYVQYYFMIKKVEDQLKAAGTFDAVNFTPNGLAGIFALYADPEAILGNTFVMEFVCDFVIGVTVWACLDPTSFMAPPAAVPWILGFVYGMIIWGFAPIGLCANPARDLGSRMMAMTIWGTKGNGGAFAAIPALTNILAMIVAHLFYEFILTDSTRVIALSHADHITSREAHAERRDGIVAPVAQPAPGTPTSYSSKDKGQIEHVEVADIV